MAKNQITGKVIAVSNIETIPSSDPSKQPMQKRKLFIDCTRFDPFTGERGYENTPLLEFGGKAMEKLNELVNQGLKKDDIVVVTFDIQGSKYTNKTTGKQDVFTRVRPYDIELYNQVKAEAPAPAPAQQQNDDSNLPF